MFSNRSALLVKPQFIKVAVTSDFVLGGFFNLLTIFVNELVQRQIDYLRAKHCEC